GKDWREMFKRHAFRVYLIDEYSTSVTCPECSSRPDSFKRVPPIGDHGSKQSVLKLNAMGF
ncbi:hypothetical protein BX666DRAFT_1860365, partial [Dichotomocladium elegans]